MIYYVAFYAEPDDKKRRNNLAGVDKANYIIDTIADLGNPVTILSNAKSVEKKGIRTEDKVINDKGVVLHTFTSWKKGNRLWDILNAAYGLMQLLIYILFNVKQSDTVIVYHSMGYRGLFALIRKVKRFHYILEVEELFQYFDANNSSYKKKENKVFEEPDAFIFSNQIIEKEINRGKKDYVIVNGIYKNEIVKGYKRDNEKVKLVYAGSLEPQKGIGIILEMAEYLTSKYELRIIGFGTEKDLLIVRDKIKKLLERGIFVRYDGVKTGNEYKKYLQTCDIGLCIQNDSDEFNKYEFPSKILSYMTNGLNVITNDLIQVRTSEVGSYINIVISNNPKEIATYINHEKYKNVDARDVIDELDDKFHQEMKKILVKGKKY